MPILSLYLAILQILLIFMQNTGLLSKSTIIATLLIGYFLIRRYDI